MDNKIKTASIKRFKLNVRLVAKRKNISINLLCNSLGRNRSYLPHLKNPSLTTIISIARVLNCEPSELLEGL